MRVQRAIAVPGGKDQFVGCFVTGHQPGLARHDDPYRIPQPLAQRPFARHAARREVDLRDRAAASVQDQQLLTRRQHPHRFAMHGARRFGWRWSRGERTHGQQAGYEQPKWPGEAGSKVHGGVRGRQKGGAEKRRAS
jgi:hypothetical protein